VDHRRDASRSRLEALSLALLAGGFLAFSTVAFAQEQRDGAWMPVGHETPLSPEAQVAVETVLRTLRSRPPASGQPILALALEVSRSPDLVLDALSETHSGASARASEELQAHARRIVELRDAIAANAGPTDGGRAAESQAGPYLDELIAALNRAANEGDHDRRANQLKTLLQRIQSGEIPIRQPYVDARAPTFLWFQGTSDSEDGEQDTPASGNEAAHAGSAGE